MNLSSWGSTVKALATFTCSQSGVRFLMEGDQFDPPVGTHQFVTVQPDGIPLVPVFHEVIDGSFTNVPDAATP